MTRSALAERFADSSQPPAKTFVVETHQRGYGSGRECLEALVADTAEVRATDDSFLHEVRADGINLWVDTLGGRYWSFHSWSGASDLKRYLKDRVERRRDVDFVWLPSAHLRNVWPDTELLFLRSDFQGQRLLPDTVQARDVRVQVRGQDSQALLDYLSENEQYRPAVAFDRVGFRAHEPQFGTSNEAVDRLGHFAAVGDSFELHQEVVRGVVSRYARLVDLVEKRALDFTPLEMGGLLPQGTPILVRFSRPVPDVDVFLSGLLSAREPFRLWGVPEETYDGVWSVDAVDLHVGQRLSLDVGADWLRVYLPRGAVGNTVVRLVSNLQHRFDGNVRFEDPELQSALTLDAIGLPSGSPAR